MKESKNPPTAMAFYNPNGFVPAFKQAKAFAGKGGRVATLPDIITARLATKPGDPPWKAYFTTMSAEYVGLSRGGSPIAIVAHGVGPMSTLDGVLAAYSHQFNDKGRNRRGGRISQEEFLKLESGGYGEVNVVDLVATWGRRPYQFSSHAITAKEIVEEPLWQARLGPKWMTYIRHHSQFAKEWEQENSKDPHTRPCILGMEDACGCSYSDRVLFDRQMNVTPGTAIAHLLSIGGLMPSHHDYYEHDYAKREQRKSLASDVSCHGWSDGTRLLGVRGGEPTSVHVGIAASYSQLLKNHLAKLWKQNPNGTQSLNSGFWNLVQMDGKHFTDYPKQGERMDNHEPEFLVTNIKEVPENPKQFRTTVGGYHGFFKYGIEEVKRIAPPEANAYTVGEAAIEWTGGDPTHHVAPVTFYKVEVDTTKRLIRMEDIYRDFELMMSLVD